MRCAYSISYLENGKIEFIQFNSIDKIDISNTLSLKRIHSQLDISEYRCCFWINASFLKNFNKRRISVGFHLNVGFLIFSTLLEHKQYLISTSFIDPVSWIKSIQFITTISSTRSFSNKQFPFEIWIETRRRSEQKKRLCDLCWRYNRVECRESTDNIRSW